MTIVQVTVCVLLLIMPTAIATGMVYGPRWLIAVGFVAYLAIMWLLLPYAR